MAATKVGPEQEEAGSGVGLGSGDKREREQEGEQAQDHKGRGKTGEKWEKEPREEAEVGKRKSMRNKRRTRNNIK